MRTTQYRLDDGTMLLLGENEGQGDVAVAGQRYGTLAELAAAYPAIGAAAQLPLCCALCLHFAGGDDFAPIGDPLAYRQRYRRLVQRGHRGMAGNFSTADFGPFDVSEVGPPQLRDGRLVFYVEDRRHGVPYRVEAAWPGPGKVKFLLLPQE